MYFPARALALLFGLSLLACGSIASGDDSSASSGAAGAAALGHAGASPLAVAGSGGASAGGNYATAGAAGSSQSCPPFAGVSVSAIGMNKLLPLPVSVTPKEGTFALSSNAGIFVEPGTPEMLAIGQYLASKLRPATGSALPVASTTGAPCAGNLYLTTQGADASLGAEGYQLDVEAQSVRLAAPQAAGLFRGLQTLRQLLPPSIETSTAQAGPWGMGMGTIRDFPRFPWRGTMLDVARHFFSVAEVQRLIDLAAYFKLNTFHLHLSDDQGFRIAIDSWPKLTSVGASTSVGGGAGGFYTKADYAAIVTYAQARYITIVPEIDVPGHTNAALASYGELNCNGVAPAMRTDTDVGYSSLCVGSDKTYQFIADVIREISAITPGAYIHLGGDEAKATTDAEFNTFFSKALPSLKAAGKLLVGWDALGQLDTLPAQTVVQYWISPDHARAAVSRGAKVLMSPANKAYLDMKYDKATPFGQSWAAYISEQAAYEWDPATVVPGVGESALVGVEAPLWTEFFSKVSDLEVMAYPRLPGYAEIAWSKATGRSWDEYKVRLASFGPRFTAWNVNYYRSSAIPWP